MLQRAGDLAHLMLKQGQMIAVASGTTANGHPCTVIYAIGAASETACEVGSMLVRRWDDRREGDRAEAKRN